MNSIITRPPNINVARSFSELRTPSQLITKYDVCAIEGCDLPIKHRDWCKKHYRRLVYRKEISITPRSRPEHIRFWEKVEIVGECWQWAASHVGEGYGGFSINHSLHYLAHRYAYETLVGAIPQGLQIDHLCRNRLCVRPDHLEPVVQRVNTLRGVSPSAVNAAKTHCKRGHEFTPDNTWFNPKKNARICVTCKRQLWREHYARNAKAINARRHGRKEAE